MQASKQRHNSQALTSPAAAPATRAAAPATPPPPAAAARRTTAPTNCNPTGSPSPVIPAGTDIAGWLDRLNGYSGAAHAAYASVAIDPSASTSFGGARDRNEQPRPASPAAHRHRPFSIGPGPGILRCPQPSAQNAMTTADAARIAAAVAAQRDLAALAVRPAAPGRRWTTRA